VSRSGCITTHFASLSQYINGSIPCHPPRFPPPPSPATGDPPGVHEGRSRLAHWRSQVLVMRSGSLWRLIKVILLGILWGSKAAKCTQ
jgi:hypothetical protein